MDKQKTKDKQDFGGWANYETWVTKFWLDNDHMKDLVAKIKRDAKTCTQVKEKIWTVKEAEKFLLANAVKENVTGEMEDEIDKECLATYLLCASISNINFEEIAGALLDN